MTPEEDAPIPRRPPPPPPGICACSCSCKRKTEHIFCDVCATERDESYEDLIVA